MLTNLPNSVFQRKNKTDHYLTPGSDKNTVRKKEPVFLGLKCYVI